MAILEDVVLEGVWPELITLRQTIHSQPDLSGHEAATATRLLDYLSPFQPDQVHEGLGGCRLAVVFTGNQAGPTTVFTCELDAVPIADHGRIDYRSLVLEADHNMWGSPKYLKINNIFHKVCETEDMIHGPQWQICFSFDIN